PAGGLSDNAVLTLMSGTPSVSSVFSVSVEGNGNGLIIPAAKPTVAFPVSSLKPQVFVGIDGDSNDLLLNVRQSGVDISGITVQFIDRGGVGNDQVIWNPFSKTLEFHVAAGTKASDIVDLLNTRTPVDDATLAARQTFKAF